LDPLRRSSRFYPLKALTNTFVPVLQQPVPPLRQLVRCRHDRLGSPGPRLNAPIERRLSHGGRLFARLLLTEGCSPVGELRDAPATGTGRQLLPACACLDGQSRVDARGPARIGRYLSLSLRP